MNHSSLGNCSLMHSHATDESALNLDLQSNWDRVSVHFMITCRLTNFLRARSQARSPATSLSIGGTLDHLQVCQDWRFHCGSDKIVLVNKALLSISTAHIVQKFVYNNSGSSRRLWLLQTNGWPLSWKPRPFNLKIWKYVVRIVQWDLTHLEWGVSMDVAAYKNPCCRPCTWACSV